MARHLPGVIWQFFRNDRYKRGHLRNGFVRTYDARRIEIFLLHDEGHGREHFTLARSDARMLAKRLNECLERTT